MEKDLDHIQDLKGGNFIYSMWEGYLQKKRTQGFIKYFEDKNFRVHHIHTSGHADVETLKQFVNAINPKNIVPIHTFHAEWESEKSSILDNLFCYCYNYRLSRILP